jgi:hypothetical protein
MQGGGNGLKTSCSHGLCAGVAFEQAKGSWTTGIGKDLSEFWEKDDEQSVDLVFVASYVIAELGMESHQFAVGGNAFSGHIAPTRFSTEEHSCDRIGIQFVRFGSEPSLLSKLMSLSWMQQAELISAIVEKAIEILPVARSGFQPNENLIGLNSQNCQSLMEEGEPRQSIGKLCRLDGLALIWLESTTATRLTANITGHPGNLMALINSFLISFLRHGSSSL